MRGLPHTWEEHTEPQLREAAAASAQHEARLLVQSPAWVELTAAIRQQVADTTSDLVRSSKDDERNRGVIDALNHVLSMPDNLIQAASAELDKHR